MHSCSLQIGAETRLTLHLGHGCIWFAADQAFAYYPLVLQDEEYEAAGATLSSTQDAFGQDIVLKIRAPGQSRGLRFLSTLLLPVACIHCHTHQQYCPAH